MSYEADELELYLVNTEACYRAWLLPAYQNLERKWKRGVFDRDLGIKLLAQYTLVSAAKQYHLEHGSMSTKWSTVFPPSVRVEAAESLLDGFLAEVKIGNTYLPTKNRIA